MRVAATDRPAQPYALDDAVLYVNNPEGVPPEIRRRMLDGLGELIQIRHEQIGDLDMLARIEHLIFLRSPFPPLVYNDMGQERSGGRAVSC